MKLKKIVSTALAAIMLAGTIATGATAAETDKTMNFTDVTEGKWFYEAVKYVLTRDLMEGKSEGKFAPTEDLTRAQFVTIIGRFAGVDGTSAATDTFSDTKKDTWYSPYIGWAVEKGIVTGYSDNTFRPGNSMTRQEMATVISRYIASEGINMPRENTAPDEFTDEENIASWAAEHVEVLRRAGVVSGKGGDNFEPKAQIKRSETAQIIMNLIEARDKAWQGYQPDPENDSYAVYGASYLYWGGTVLSSYLGTDIETDTSEYPVLSAYYDKDWLETQSSRYTTDGNEDSISNTVGMNITEGGLILEDFPIVKIAYRYNGMDEPETLKGIYTVNPVSAGMEWVASDRYMVSYEEHFTFTKGAEDAGFKTATADLSAIAALHPEIGDDEEFLNSFNSFVAGSYAPAVNSNIDVTHVLLEAYDKGYTGDCEVEILYMAFFKNEADAAAFTASSQEDYLKNYFRYSSLVYEELTDEIAEDYDELLVNRINEILNKENTVDPADYNTVYYVSSINGDDSNTGLSPDQAWKSFENLTYTVAGGLITRSKALPGDAVLFERGSEWYAEQYNNSTMTCLGIWEGVTYSSYGEGAKPAFYGAIDLRDKGNTGNWERIYEGSNIWVLDEIDPDPDWCGSRTDVGNIIFDNGKAIGVKVLPVMKQDDMDTESPFAPGRVTYYHGLLSGDGKTYFSSGGTSCESIEQVLQYNYQFFHDMYEGKLYLYWDQGNPSDSFEDIKLSRVCYVLGGGDKDSVVDNLAVLHSSTWGAAVEGVIQNCEIGYVAGSVGSIESGTEISGESDGTYLYDNYVHDIGDGPLSLQSTKEWPDEGKDYFNPVYIQNAELSGNVVVACGNGFEIWNHSGPLDGYGVAHNKIMNISVHDNIFAYIGYGLSQYQSDREHSYGTVFCTYGEMENCVNRDNIIMYPNGEIFGPHVGNDYHSRGWAQQGNTYILNPAHMYYGIATMGVMSTQNSHSYAFKASSMRMDYSYRYMSFLASVGIETTGKYYITDNSTEAQDNGSFFMTGYYVLNGGLD